MDEGDAGRQLKEKREGATPPVFLCALGGARFEFKQ